MSLFRMLHRAAAWVRAQWEREKTSSRNYSQETAADELARAVTAYRERLVSEALGTGEHPVGIPGPVERVERFTTDIRP